jgi:hypothetical protein
MKYLKRYCTSWTFIGRDFVGKEKYRLAKWGIICRPKDQGGSGVLNLELQNKCLLSKWLFSLINSDGAWQNLIRNKYMGSKIITQVTKNS